MGISLEKANQIIAATIVEGVGLGLKPLSVAVLDPGANLIAFQRADGSPNLRHAIAIGKASAALGLGVSSRKIGDMAGARPHFVQAVGHLAGAGFVPVAGGVIVVDGAGGTIGAVGVSGDTSENDEACAKAGILRAGLSPQADLD